MSTVPQAQGPHNADGRGTPREVEFFRSLFSGCTGSVYFVAFEADGGFAGHLHIRAPHDWFRALAWARRHSEAGRNVYFSPLTQSPDATGTRSEATAFELAALFGDVDAADGRPLDADTWARLDATGLVTLAVFSGYGLHPYAKLPEPLRITDENREHLKDLLYAYGAALNERAHGESRRVDRHDLASLLRVPGTINYPNAKKRAAGRVSVATAVHMLSERTVPLDTFDDWAARYPRPSRGAARAPSTSTVGKGVGEPPPDFETWLGEDDVLRGYFERTLPPQGRDQSPSAYAMALANRLAKIHPEISDDGAVAVLHAFYERAGKTKHVGALRQTWDRARAAYADDDEGSAIGGAVPPSGEGDGPPSVAAMPFPVDVLPAPLRRFVEEGAAAFQCPPDFIAVPMLPILGAAIGTSYVVEVKSGWRESPALYVAVVGDPGTVKSPVLKRVAAPVYDRERELHINWMSETFRHRDNENERKAKQSERADKDKGGEKNGEKKHKQLPTPPPTLTRAVTTDTTTEALALLLSENPRGVLLLHDELTQLIHAMNQYKRGGGADRQFFLSAWSGASIIIDRKGDHNAGPIRAENPFLTICGLMTPDLLGSLREHDGGEDGFLGRFLFAFPDAPVSRAWTEATVSTEAADAWSTALKFLWDLKAQEGLAGPFPYALVFSPTASAAWIEFYNRHNAEVATLDFPHGLRGVWRKLEGYCARLALILHLSRVACRLGDIGAVDEASVQGAARLVDYFKSHARRVYRRMPVSAQERQDDQALAWIRKQGGCVKARDVQHHHVAGVKTAAEAKALLRRLQARGLGTIDEQAKDSVLFKLSG